MDFCFQETRMLNNIHEYKRNDGLIHNNIHNCDFALMINGSYLGIDVNSLNRRLYGVSGYVDIKKLQRGHICIPNKKKEGAIYVNNCDLIPGTGKDYWISEKAKFDIKTNCICLGDDTHIAETIEISKGVLMNVYKGQIVAIFIMPRLLR